MILGFVEDCLFTCQARWYVARCSLIIVHVKLGDMLHRCSLILGFVEDCFFTCQAMWYVARCSLIIVHVKLGDMLLGAV